MIETADIPTATRKDEHRWSVLQRRVQEAHVSRAFSIFREQGIEPILIKGYAALRNYPPSRLRISTDIDLAVRKDDFAAARKLSRSIGATGLAIDVHNELRHLDTLEWVDLWSNSIMVDVQDGPIRILRPEDHLRVLCVHWLTDGGAFKERLWDIFYAIENAPADFDWDRCLNVVSPNRRRWIVCVIGLAEKTLALNTERLAFLKAEPAIPAWFERAIEREWASTVKLSPLDIYLRDPANLLKQIKKRIPPNPIQSTVDVEGSFDARTRVHYQFMSLIKRSVSSVERNFPTVFSVTK